MSVSDKVVRVGAWLTLLALSAWTVWFAASVWFPENVNCFDGEPRCVYSGTESPTWERALRYGAWFAAFVFALLSVALARPRMGASFARIAVPAVAALACLTVVLVSLGAVFPEGVPEGLPGY